MNLGHPSLESVKGYKFWDHGSVLRLPIIIAFIPCSAIRRPTSRLKSDENNYTRTPYLSHKRHHERVNAIRGIKEIVVSQLTAAPSVLWTAQSAQIRYLAQNGRTLCAWADLNSAGSRPPRSHHSSSWLPLAASAKQLCSLCPRWSSKRFLRDYHTNRITLWRWRWNFSKHYE